ncbi:MAG: hypothetical protein H5T44_05405 [Thermoplasmatales archaeon]|nr:hypothetical protein [Thermoplasmatales archaeon]
MKKLITFFLSLALIPVNLPLKSGNDDFFHDCMREWWNVDAFIKADKNYSITASFEYEKETPAANLFFTIFDHDDKIVYNLSSYEDDIDEIKFGEGLNITYKNSSLHGEYPYYIFHLENKGVAVRIYLEAISPKKIVSDGAIPIGFGSYYYLFVPECRAWGWIEFYGSKKEFEGIAYFEHVWGNWSYNKPLSNFSIETIKNYVRIFRWWAGNANLSFSSFSISSDNPFGYDWSWGWLYDGRAIFFGNIPFWINELNFGVLYIYDGEIREVKNLKIEYLDGIYFEGAFIPKKIKISNENFSIVLEMGDICHVYLDNLPSFYWKKLILYEAPGKIYENGKEIGKCEIEIERQVSIFEYFLLKLYFSNSSLNFIFISYLLNLIFGINISINPFSFSIYLSKIRKDLMG